MKNAYEFLYDQTGQTDKKFTGVTEMYWDFNIQFIHITIYVTFQYFTCLLHHYKVSSTFSFA